MTERTYFLYLKGNRDKEIDEARKQRQLLWAIYCSYPKEKGKEIKSIFDFMPLEGDPEKRQISQEQLHEAMQKFRNLGKKKD